jgi:methylated-DNA-[protein]-cysteine S-methyltransferase
MPFALLAASPLGLLQLRSADGETLSAIRFDAGPGVVGAAAEPATVTPAAVLAETARQLGEYFAGARRVFELPLAPAGSPFQQSVWEALLDIPYGQTRTYGDVARRLGLPLSASRAVGAANGANPIPVVVPCHRVIGAGGRLTGYGGGLERKEALLRLEGVRTERDQLQLF